MELSISGPERVAFGEEHQRCDITDIPDAMVRAFRRSDGESVLIASYHEARAFTGPSLRSLHKDCSVMFRGAQDPRPQALNDEAWIAATWKGPSRLVYAISHSEYQAQKYAGQCKFKNYNQCWYNVLRFLISKDDGRTFSYANDKVIAPDIRQDSDQGRNRGFFAPSNIVRSGNFLYFVAYTTGTSRQPRGSCLFRAPVPTSELELDWQGYDGRSFSVKPFNPYSQDPSRYLACFPVLKSPLYSIVYHDRSGQFVATVALAEPKSGYGYIVSRDLLHWSPVRPLLFVPRVQSRNCADKYRYSYPSIIDPDAADVNYQSLGDNGLLFLVRMTVDDCHGSMQRELVVFPVSVAN